MNLRSIDRLTKRQFDKVLEREGKTITDYFSGEEYRVFFRRAERSQSPSASVKIFYAQDSGITIGTTIVINGENYIVYSQDGIESDIYYTSVANRCDNTLRAVLNGKTVEVPIIMFKDKYSVFHGTFVSETTGSIIVYAGDNEYSRTIAVNNLYNKYGNYYSVQNRIFNSGIGYFFMEQELTPAGDYSVEYTGDTYFMLSSDTYQTDFVATKAGVVLDPQPVLSYSSSDTSVATIDSTGLLTFMGIGNSIITCTDTEHNVSSAIEIFIIDSVTHRFEITTNRPNNVWFSNNSGQTVTINRAIFTLHSYDAVTGVEDTTSYLINESHELRFYVSEEHQSDVVWKEFETDGPNVRRGYFVTLNTIRHWGSGDPVNVYAELDGQTVAYITMIVKKL